MGRPSVSEALTGPLGRSEEDALPPSQAAPRPWPPRLRLLAASAEELRFVGWWPARAPLLLTPVLLALGSLSWLAPTPAGAARTLVSLLVLGAALGLILACRPRRVVIRLRPRERRLISSRGEQRLTERARWLLIAEQPEASPQPEYAALLVDGERRWRLLAAADPALLLRELRRVLACWPSQVEQDWGLPSSAQPWDFEPRVRTPAGAGGEPHVLSGARTGRMLRWGMLAMTAFVLVDLTALVLSAGAQVPAVHPLSVVLAVLAASCQVTIAVAVITRQGRLRLGSDWLQEQRVVGLWRVQQAIPADSVRGVHRVGVRAGRLQHLLIDGSEGPLSLLVSADAAERLRETLAREIPPALEPAAPANESAASAPRRWRSG